MRSRGFTLVEMLIVVLIVGILASIAFPSYQRYVLQAGRADGKAKLMEIMQAQERYYSQHQTYVVALNGSATANPPTGLGYRVTPVPSDEGRYTVEAAPCGNTAGLTIASCVRLTATRTGAQANDAECGNLTLDSRGTRGITGNGNVDTCW